MKPPRRRLWIGRGVTTLPVLFLAFDTAIKLVPIEPVRESLQRLGYPVAMARGIGLLELCCLLLYLAPRSSVVGAALLTGFLGGAVATHVRVEDPLFSHVLFPIYVGALLWIGLWLRDGRLLWLFERSPLH
jgi:hypothetical protein